MPLLSTHLDICTKSLFVNP